MIYDPWGVATHILRTTEWAHTYIWVYKLGHHQRGKWKGLIKIQRRYGP